jgi:hypothetical protein
MGLSGGAQLMFIFAGISQVMQGDKWHIIPSFQRRSFSAVFSMLHIRQGRIMISEDIQSHTV